MALDLIPVDDGQPQEPSAPKLDLIPVEDDPKLPDTSGIEKMAQENMAQQENSGQQTPAKNLNAAMGYNALSPPQNTPLPEGVRRHINQSYTDGTATTAADWAQTAIPAVAHAIIPGATGSWNPGATGDFGLQANGPGMTFLKAMGVDVPSMVASVPPFSAAAGFTAKTLAPMAKGEVGTLAVGGISIVAGTLAAMASSGVTKAGQDAFLKAHPEIADAVGISPEQLKLNAEAHPWMAKGGALASQLIAFKPGISPIKTMLTNAGLMGGIETGREVISGEKLSPEDILAQTITGAIMKENSFGKKLSSIGEEAVSRISARYAAMKSTISEKTGVPADQVTPDHTDSTIAGAYTHDVHPHAQDYHVAATAIFGKDGAENGTALLKKINSETGIRPEEVHADTVSNPEILKQILSGDVPKEYDHLREPLETIAEDAGLKAEKTSESQTSSDTVDTKNRYEQAKVNGFKDLPPDNEMSEAISLNEELHDGYEKAKINGFSGNLHDYVSSLDPATQDQFGKALWLMKWQQDSASGGNGGKEPPSQPPSSEETPEYTAAKNKILDTISIGEQEPQKPGLTWDKIYTAIVDKLNPIKESMQSLGQKISSDKDAYKIMRLMASVGDKGKHFLEHGTIDFNTGKINGKSLKEVLAPVKDDLNGFRAYITSKRALELESRGIKTGKDADAARRVINGGMERFEATSKELNDYQTRLLKYLKDAGILNDDQFSAIKKSNADYIPYYRLMEEGERSGGPTSGSPIKSIKGSERITIDPLESIIRNTYAFTKIAEKNTSVKSAYDNWSAQPHPEDYFTLDNAKPAPVKITDREMQKFLKDNNIHDVPEDALTIFRASRRPLSKDQIGFFDNGKFTVLKVDPDMAEAFNSVPKEQHNLLMSLLKFPASALRAGLTTPEFIVRHLIRNQLSASTLSEKGNIPFYDTYKGLISYLKKDEDYQMALRSGALPSIEPFLDRDTVQEQLKKLTSTSEGSVQKLKEHLTGDSILDTAKNVVKSPIDFLHALQQTLETSTRLGAFKRAIGEQDQTKANMVEAAFHARNIAPDPGRIGSKTGLWNSITALFNTEIQHTDQLTNALRKNTLPTLAKLFAGITLPSIALWIHNKDNPLYQNTPPWEKDFFWIVPLGDRPGDTVLRIPKPFLMGEVFGSVPERILDKLFEHDPNNFGLEHLANDLGSWATPNIIPTGPEAVIEHLTNHSFFKGENLVPDRQSGPNGPIPEERFTPYTSELTKSLGSAIGHVPILGNTSLASPIILDNYIYKWTGGIGTYIWQTADKALRSAGVLPDPVKPASTLADDPFIKAFVSRNPASNAAPILEFEENFKQKQEIYNTIKSAEKDEDQDKADAIRKRFSFDDDDYARLKDTNDGIINEYKTIKDIQKNPEISPQEKRQLIDQAYNEMIQATKSANEYPNKSIAPESDNDNVGEEQP